ncbi:MAG: DUF58 domain-containing protein [Acidobacteriota bacterium]|nr:DUF58 domain-containing protein [Acidobacteriota bacterium]
MTASLIPAAASARAVSRKRLPFGCGVRFFIALVVGLVWLIPAWWSPRLIAAMFVWDGFLVTAWLLDLMRLPKPSAIEVRRIWETPLELGRPSAVSIELTNLGAKRIRANLIDQAPVAVRDVVPMLNAVVAGGDRALQQYSIVPRERGDIRFGDVFLRYRSELGLAERWAVAAAGQTVCVLPDLVQAQEQALYLIRSRQVEIEKRRRRLPGIGREFKTLRDYRQGDELRDICWSATARRNHLVTRTYEAERSQTVWIVVDAGRLLRAQITEHGSDVRLTKLDYAVNAALALAQVASQFGDKVGLLAYGRAIQQSVGPGRGSKHIRVLMESLARVRGEAIEANHNHAARVLLRSQSRRALVVWITDFAETPTTPDVVEYAVRTSRRHLVMFATVSQPDLAMLAAAVPQSEAEMFRHVAAVEIAQRRELLLRGLRQSGVLAMELAPGRLASSVVNEYLQIKDRNLI